MTTLHTNNPAHLAAFVALNEAWISEHFEIEEADRRLAANPGAIAAAGGVVFSATVDGAVAGVCAVVAKDDEVQEFIRFAVDPAYRGLGIGRRLIEAAIAYARSNGARQLELYSNTKLTTARALYDSVGFRVSREGPHPDYRRVNVIMTLDL
ncbi:ribosomal-protein-alanine N-acetyltransferase [Posidoniimonas corsicana]|uniref:Ribosomal-protein-alanine N-acetyltransferase n=1 Tax=Posidoniimonas corsicana TaxID=1938618 RepID=A0A5C5UX65_9BACT|nr:GNAT family N-acetyltransferase [Posidoniimonas corsicana]TWT30180.1 ribosomal-protein-alanine N-acetyltransferase [Posidoniimonas corsicana]